MLQAGSNIGKRKTLMCLLPYRARFVLQLSTLIVIERVILIILRKSPARFLSLMLNLVFPTNNQNDDQKEKKFRFKTKIMDRIQHSSSIFKKSKQIRYSFWWSLMHKSIHSYTCSVQQQDLLCPLCFSFFSWNLR